MNQSLQANTLASAGAIIAAASMLLLGVGANLGIYEGAAVMMQQWHLFFSFSLMGIIAGMIEAAIITYVFLYALAWMYNRLLQK